VCSRNSKLFTVSSLVLNLFASQIGEFFLPRPVYNREIVCVYCAVLTAALNIIQVNDIV